MIYISFFLNSWEKVAIFLLYYLRKVSFPLHICKISDLLPPKTLVVWTEIKIVQARNSYILTCFLSLINVCGHIFNYLSVITLARTIFFLMQEKSASHMQMYKSL